MTGRPGSPGILRSPVPQASYTQPEIPRKPCLVSIFELSVHGLGTILKSDVQTFQSGLCSLVPLKIVQVELKKHSFRLRNTRDLFFWKKTSPAGLHHTESQSGDVTTNYFLTESKYPNIQISKMTNNYTNDKNQWSLITSGNQPPINHRKYPEP